MDGKLNSFISIDFETANPKRVSACSLGVVKVVDGVVAYSKYFLIKPVGEYYAMNTSIHGLKEEDTKYSPTFDIIFEELRTDFENMTVLSYSSFDRSVFEELVRYYNIQLKNNVVFLDVCDIASSALNLPNYKLPTVAYYLGLDKAEHHNAQCDAEQCARIYLKLLPIIKFVDVRPSENYSDSFTNLINEIIADGVIETEEAYELLRFLDGVADYNKVFKLLYDLVNEVLDDGVVSKEESDMLISVVRYVMSKYKAFQSCKCTNECVASVGHMDTAVEVFNLEVPENFQPVPRTDIPKNYKEHWEYIKQHPFKTIASANVVITGNGCRISRETAEEFTVKLGGILKSGSTRNTDLCVCLGNIDTTTGKAQKARELIQEGSSIRIIDENEFIDMLKATIEEEH